jgi:hypothetical protein
VIDWVGALEVTGEDVELEATLEAGVELDDTWLVEVVATLVRVDEVVVMIGVVVVETTVVEVCDICVEVA